MNTAIDGPRPESLAHFRLPSCDDLVGRSIKVSLVDGGAVHLDFTGNGKANWSVTGVAWSGEGTATVDVVAVAEGTYFIDVDFVEPALESLTLVVREPTGWALAVHQSRFHPEDTWSRGPEVIHTFAVGRIDGLAQAGPAPAPTRELLGRRHLHRYSPNNLYEHIYLNSRKFCAHNVHTFGTPGRADCHPATYHKVDDGLYVFCWREYDSAAAMVTFLNLATGQVTGKVHHPEQFLQSISRPFGGYIIPVTERIEYPDGLVPE